MSPRDESLSYRSALAEMDPQLKAERTKVIILARQMFDIRDRLLAYDPNKQMTFVDEAITALTDRDCADRFIEYHFASKTPWIDREELEGLPQRAIDRMYESLRLKTQHAWFTVALDPYNSFYENELRLGHSYKGRGAHDDFEEAYLQIARSYRLYPCDPTIENVRFQRILPHDVRSLYVNMEFMTNLGKSRSFRQSTRSPLGYIAQAMEVYGAVGIQELQEIIRGKTGFDEEKAALLEASELWDNHEDLVAMCTDRGVRDHIIDLYGIYRSFSSPAPVSGYHVGQEILARRSQMNRIMRVAA